MTANRALPAQTPANAAPSAAKPCWGWLAVALLGLLAAGASVYLAVMATASAAVAGCGAGGCAQLVGSRWARWCGLPVAMFGAGTYLSILVVALLERFDSRRRRAYRGALLSLALVAAAAACYFLFIEAAVLRQFCVYCNVVHAAGLAMVGLLLYRHRFASPVPACPTPARRWRAVQVLLFVGTIGILAGGQVAAPGPASIVHHGLSYTTIGGERAVRLPGADALLSVGAHPRLGPPDARHIFVLFSDYTCGLCRDAHAKLTALLQRYPRQLAILVLPVPLDRACNPAYPPTAEPKVDACQLARLALAVWRVSAAQFPDFDAYLMSAPPSLLLGNPHYNGQLVSIQAARAEAARRVGQVALDTALNPVELDAQLGAYANLMVALPLPTRASPTLVTEDRIIQGPVNADELAAWLEERQR